MSRSLVQPVGQKRLTNVATVRLKKHGLRFEIACYKNKVLSWRSRVEKDIDEVLQAHKVYANVSKGVLAKSKDLIQVFGTDDEEKICLEILEKGELQVAGKEREAKLSSQFRDIATIVMEKTVNPKTERPHTISMIERLMHEVHFAVDPNKSSKQQALELIKDLEKQQFPITRARMKLRITIPIEVSVDIRAKLDSWNAKIEQYEEISTQLCVVCQVDPGYFRECDTLVRGCNGKLEMISMAVQREGVGTVDEYDALESANNTSEQEIDRASHSLNVNLVSQMNNLAMASSAGPSNASSSSSSGIVTNSGEVKKQMRCNTCNAEVGDAKQYREHFKSEWHNHNLKRKTQQMPPLSQDECLVDTAIGNGINDMNEYSR